MVGTWCRWLVLNLFRVVYCCCTLGVTFDRTRRLWLHRKRLNSRVRRLNGMVYGIKLDMVFLRGDSSTLRHLSLLHRNGTVEHGSRSHWFLHPRQELVPLHKHLSHSMGSKFRVLPLLLRRNARRHSQILLHGCMVYLRSLSDSSRYADGLPILLASPRQQMVRRRKHDAHFHVDLWMCNFCKFCTCMGKSWLVWL